MRHLIDNLDKIEKRFKNKYIMLFLDYDGTVVPIAESPGKAVISKRAKDLLKKIARSPRCKLAVISGRALTDVKNMVGVKGIIYSGNHGLEIEGPRIKFESQVSSVIKSIIRQIYKALSIKLSKIKGIIVENKNLAISIHYRLVNISNVNLIKKIVSEITRPYVAAGKIEINAGKKVIEIKPAVEWNKGKVVLWLLARQKFTSNGDKIFPIYIGDDVTDEDAFKVLKNKGLTVFIGEPKTSYARFYLKDTEEVMQFLNRILCSRGKVRCRN